MNNINKIDEWLIRQSAHSKNYRDSNDEITIGRLINNLTYINNDPLNIYINSTNSLFKNNEIEFCIQTGLEIQYIKRIQYTPFYISYLAGSDYSLKIIDFYQWKPVTIVYRIMIIKNNNVIPKRNTDFYLNCNNKIKVISDNDQSAIFELENVAIQLPENAKFKDRIEIPLQLESEDQSFHCFAFHFNKIQMNVDFEFENITKILKNLCNECTEGHIGKYFATKHKPSETELDDLWTKQKYILPDMEIDSDLLSKIFNKKYDLLWISEFLQYFGLNDKIVNLLKSKECDNLETLYHQVVVQKNEKSGYTDIFENLVNPLSNDFLPELHNKPETKKEILKLYFIPESKNKAVDCIVQRWWDIYSASIFSEVLNRKYLNNPDELFAIYFFTVRAKMPISVFLFNFLDQLRKKKKENPLHSFLFLLAFLFSRIHKSNLKGNKIEFIPGYQWDNNVKILISKSADYSIRYSRFSGKNFSILSHSNKNILKIDKECIISVEDYFNKFIINPKLFDSANKFNLRNICRLQVDSRILTLPLIWNIGELSFFGINIKWLLKKNRFQLTVHSSSTQTVLINNQEYMFEKKKKYKIYQESKRVTPEINLNIYDSKGRSIHSKLKNNSIIIDGYVLTADNILNEKLLYKIGKIRKHVIDLGKNNDSIQNDSFAESIQLYAKSVVSNKKIKYFKNSFINKLLESDYNVLNNFLILIDFQFKNELSLLLNMFNQVFGYIPEYLVLKNGYTKFNSQLIGIWFRKSEGSNIICHINNENKNFLEVSGEHVRDTFLNFLNYILENI